MHKILLIFFITSFVFLLLLTACSSDNPAAPVSSNNTDTDQRINGPNEEDYDFYIGMSYSDPQPQNPRFKRFYIIIACEDSTQEFQSPELEIEGVSINLEYADYGRDFYIAYFNLVYADTFHFKFTINGKTVQAGLNMINELEMELPESLVPNQDVILSWETENDPQVIYIEGFQNNNSDELLQQRVKNLEPETRSFTMPAAWLWSEPEASNRAIQVGIMNYNIVDRVCFTISDGAYKSY